MRDGSVSAREGVVVPPIIVHGVSGEHEVPAPEIVSVVLVAVDLP